MICVLGPVEQIYINHLLFFRLSKQIQSEMMRWWDGEEIRRILEQALKVIAILAGFHKQQLLYSRQYWDNCTTVGTGYSLFPWLLMSFIIYVPSLLYLTSENTWWQCHHYHLALFQKTCGNGGNWHKRNARFTCHGRDHHSSSEENSATSGYCWKAEQAGLNTYE